MSFRSVRSASDAPDRFGRAEAAPGAPAADSARDALDSRAPREETAAQSPTASNLGAGPSSRERSNGIPLGMAPARARQRPAGQRRDRPRLRRPAVGAGGAPGAAPHLPGLGPRR